jgi:V8-like Glu-specific endopeptidase
MPCRTVGQIQYCQGPDDCGYSCTGTLIGPATVLTAGHCLYEPGVAGLDGGSLGAIAVRHML